MRRIPLFLAVALLAILAIGGSAQAAGRLSAAQVATTLKANHAFAQPGASPKPDIAALRAVAAANPSFYLVVLKKPLAGATNAKGSARLLTLALQPTDPKATVGVVQGGKLGGASLSYPQERINKAVSDSGKVAGTDPTGALTSFTQAVSKPNINPSGGGSGSGGGGTPFWQWLILIIFIAGIVLVVLRIRARSNEQRRRRRGGSIWTAREFHLDRLESLAARHAALTGETSGGTEDPGAMDHLQTAGARLLALRRTLPALTSPRELRTVASELDAVEWEILWVEYRVSDHAPPSPIMRGFPGLCFFSHEYGLGTEPIELRKPDGTIATVYVSPENRLALERGDAPAVSLVHVGARMVPWPTAPSWYGAYGWNADDLPGLEYGGQQIWGIDGPEDVEQGEDGVPAADEPLVSYPADGVDATGAATAAVTASSPCPVRRGPATRTLRAPGTPKATRSSRAQTIRLCRRSRPCPRSPSWRTIPIPIPPRSPTTSHRGQSRRTRRHPRCRSRLSQSFRRRSRCRRPRRVPSVSRSSTCRRRVASSRNPLTRPTTTSSFPSRRRHPR